MDNAIVRSLPRLKQLALVACVPLFSACNTLGGISGLGNLAKEEPIGAILMGPAIMMMCVGSDVLTLGGALVTNPMCVHEDEAQTQEAARLQAEAQAAERARVQAATQQHSHTVASRNTPPQVESQSSNTSRLPANNYSRQESFSAEREIASCQSESRSCESTCTSSAATSTLLGVGALIGLTGGDKDIMAALGKKAPSVMGEQESGCKDQCRQSLSDCMEEVQERAASYREMEMARNTPPSISPSSAGGNCPSSLAHIAPQLPSYSHPTLRSVRNTVLSTDVRSEIRRARSSGYSMSQVAAQMRNNWRQADAELPRMESCIRQTQQYGADATIAQLKAGTYSFESPSIHENCAGAYVNAYYQAVTFRAIADAAACWAASGVDP